MRIAVGKQLAKLHETKRKDLVAAGHAWARIATFDARRRHGRRYRAEDVREGRAPRFGGSSDRRQRRQRHRRTCARGSLQEARELRRASGDLGAAGGRVLGSGPGHPGFCRLGSGLNELIRRGRSVGSGRGRERARTAREDTEATSDAVRRRSRLLGPRWGPGRRDCSTRSGRGRRSDERRDRRAARASLR